MDEVEAALAEQLTYYRSFARHYDIAYIGKPWDRCLDELPIVGDVLELACGTGHWTPLLARRASSVTALDAAPETLAIARRRVGDLRVDFVHADVFGWRPPRRYDTVFFGFWLTHVPPARFAAFWTALRAALRPGGRVCFVDSSVHEREGERVVPGQTVPSVWRSLADGSDHRVVKVFYTPAELEARLAGLGWTARVRETDAGPMVGTAWSHDSSRA
jgi:demethylmenaquinone methyltransferase/2-methoxy-6-polyprenyl-1,4-benzoquinol methylase